MYKTQSDISTSSWYCTKIRTNKNDEIKNKKITRTQVYMHICMETSATEDEQKSDSWLQYMELFLGRGFGKNEVEWTEKAEIKTAHVPGSKQITQSCILIYSRLLRENLW